MIQFDSHSFLDVFQLPDGVLHVPVRFPGLHYPSLLVFFFTRTSRSRARNVSLLPFALRVSSKHVCLSGCLPRSLLSKSWQPKPIDYSVQLRVGSSDDFLPQISELYSRFSLIPCNNGAINWQPKQRSFFDHRIPRLTPKSALEGPENPLPLSVRCEWGPHVTSSLPMRCASKHQKPILFLSLGNLHLSMVTIPSRTCQIVRDEA